MATNIVENINVVLRKAQDFSIVKLMDHIRCLLQQWFWKCRNAFISMTITLTKCAEKEMNKRYEFSTFYNV